MTDTEMGRREGEREIEKERRQRDGKGREGDEERERKREREKRGKERENPNTWGVIITLHLQVYLWFAPGLFHHPHPYIPSGRILRVQQQYY